MAKTTKNIYENAEGCRIFIIDWHEDFMTPLAARSALDACLDRNADTEATCNAIAEALNGIPNLNGRNDIIINAMVDHLLWNGYRWVDAC